jgi:hypothetical protein
MAALWCSATSVAFSPHFILCRDRTMPAHSSEPKDHDFATSPDGRSEQAIGPSARSVERKSGRLIEL